MKGVVKWFKDEKGYGFITPNDGGKDVFVHHSAIQSDKKFKTLKEGDQVEFETEDSEKGIKAVDVRVVG